MKAYKINEVCQILSISRRTFYNWEVSGKIKVVMINGQKRVLQEEIDRLLRGE